METSPAPAVRTEDVPKTVTDGPVAVHTSISEQNTQSAVANSGLKESTPSSIAEPVISQASPDKTSSATVATNGVNGVNGLKSSNVNGVANGSIPAAVASVLEAATIATPMVEDGDTVMTVEYTEPRVTSVAEPSDPAPQQPTSDLRSSTGLPVPAEQVNEIKESKQLSDLASDKELAKSMAESSTAPIERSLSESKSTPVVETIETTINKKAETPVAADVDIPLHPSAPTPQERKAPSKSTEPTPAPITTEKLESTPALAPPSQDQDTAMTDAPPSPSKISRNREEDDEEPVTKRLKADDGTADADFKMLDAPVVETAAPVASTEQQGQQQEEQTAPVASAPAADPASLGPGSESARRKDPDYEKPMTGLQKKHLAKVVNTLKRSKWAPNFKIPVDPVALKIPTYFDIVKEPMDLATVEEKFKASQYPTVAALWDDLDLIVRNCVKFNGAAHVVTSTAYGLRDTYDRNLNQTPAADAVDTKADKKKRPSIEKPAAPPPKRRESRSSVQAKSPAAASPTQTFALNSSGLPTIRRDSTITDGRPRREIHPPAPKDLPYSNQRPRKKKFQWELKWCQDVVTELKKPKYHAIAYAFLQPVDPVALNIPNYHKIIKKPMDVSTIETKLKSGEYENAKEFDADMRLMFQNCYKFNPPDDAIHKAGKNLEALYDERWENRKEWIKDHSPAAPLSAESSPEASEEEEEEEASEEEEEEVFAAQQISSLEKQLEELKRQVNEKKKKTPPTKAKKGKKGVDTTASSSKKKSSTSAGGGASGGGKKAKGGKADKKESKTKKPPKAPYVTYEQKQDISARINNLPENRMATALAIIRENMPNLKGVQDDEIELDIDELSNDVLYKLLQFVRKYAPLPDDDKQHAPARSSASAPLPPAATSSKPKKAKPMGKHEQEARIRELKEKLNGVASSEDEGLANAVAESSDDDSEESEED